MYIKAISENRTKIKSAHLKNINNDVSIPFNTQLVSTFPQLSHNFCLLFSSVQLLSHVQLFATSWTAACQASVSITNSQSLLKLMSTESVMPQTISSSVVPFSSCPQSFTASFQMSQLFASGGQSIGVSVLPVNIQD